MPSADLARQRAHMPAETSRILNTRSLPTAHRRLADLLQPGMRVLDVGCGTGAITRDMADAVAPAGLVVGVDMNPTLLAQARQQHQAVRNLQVVEADLFALPFRRGFDLVTAARVLQWVAQPREAIRGLMRAVNSSGLVLVLDYNHERIQWTPAPPASLQRFYAAFLRWRAEAGLDNAIADHLARLFQQVGLVDIRVTPQPERTQRGEAEFATRIGLWAEVAATRGHTDGGGWGADGGGAGNGGGGVSDMAADRGGGTDALSAGGRRPRQGGALTTRCKRPEPRSAFSTSEHVLTALLLAGVGGRFRRLSAGVSPPAWHQEPIGSAGI